MQSSLCPMTSGVSFFLAWPVGTGTVLSSTLRWLFVWPGQFSHTYVPISTLLNTQGDLSASLEFSLYVALSSLFCGLQRTWSTQIHNSVSSTQEICWALPGFPFPILQPRHSLQALVEGIPRFYIISFLFLRDHSSCLPDVQCLIYFLSAFCLFGEGFVSGRRVNLAPVTPSLLKAGLQLIQNYL